MKKNPSNKASPAISVSRMSSGSNKGKSKHASSKSKIKALSKTMKGKSSKAMDVSELYSASKGQMSSLISSGKSKNDRSRTHTVSQSSSRLGEEIVRQKTKKVHKKHKKSKKHHRESKKNKILIEDDMLPDTSGVDIDLGLDDDLEASELKK